MPRPCFHKLVLPTTVQSRQLRIPDNFLRKYGSELSSVATISVPDGSVWRVGLKKADNKYWFVDGWAEFSQRYSISVGNFLVFRYEGKSSFSVHIFNLATSEVNYQAAARSSNEGAFFANRLKIFEEMEDEDYIDSTAGNTQPALQNLFNGSKLNRVNWGEGGNALSSRDIGVQFNALEFKKSTDELKLRASFEEKAKKSAKKKRKSEGGPETSDDNEEETELRIRFYESASARKRTVTAEEREKAVNEAKAFEPANPFCRVVLRPSYLYRGCIMYLPSCFAEKHLNGVSGFIKLQLPDGKEWPVRCLYRSGRAKLSQGWFEFALDNNLGEGDVCVFELLRMKEVVLQVTIFRVTEEEELLSPPLPPQQNQPVNQPKLLRTPMPQHQLATSKLIRN